MGGRGTQDKNEFGEERRQSTEIFPPGDKNWLSVNFGESLSVNILGEGREREREILFFIFFFLFDQSKIGSKSDNCKFTVLSPDTVNGERGV